MTCNWSVGHSSGTSMSLWSSSGDETVWLVSEKLLARSTVGTKPITDVLMGRWDVAKAQHCWYLGGYWFLCDGYMRLRSCWKWWSKTNYRALISATLRRRGCWRCQRRCCGVQRRCSCQSYLGIFSGRLQCVVIVKKKVWGSGKLFSHFKTGRRNRRSLFCHSWCGRRSWHCRLDCLCVNKEVGVVFSDVLSVGWGAGVVFGVIFTFKSCVFWVKFCVACIAVPPSDTTKVTMVVLLIDFNQSPELCHSQAANHKKNMWSHLHLPIVVCGQRYSNHLRSSASCAR